LIRAVFFDAAGTLFEPREPIGRTYARLARDFGLDTSEDAVAASFRRAFGAAPGLAFGLGLRHDEVRRLEREWWRDRVRETFAPHGKFPDFDAYFDALFAHFANPGHWIADLEAAPMLQRLKIDGLKLGVISNFDFRLYRILDGLDLTRYFDSITISSEAGYAKPRREVYDAALARAGVTAGEAMHVGDSEHLDFAPAAALGMAAVLIDRETRQAAPSVAGRTARICSLASVIEVARVLGLA
jgi:putative hydrolase of the HAD superfamily